MDFLGRRTRTGIVSEVINGALTSVSTDSLTPKLALNKFLSDELVDALFYRKPINYNWRRLS